MHLGNGTVTPACALYGLGVAGAGFACGYLMARRTQSPNPLRYAAGTALVFALQAINVPVAAGVSGHLVGGFLLAAWFGSGWGLLASALVLALQSVLFADGGWMTLGLNLLNMGIVPCLVIYPLWRQIFGQARGPSRWGSIALASWLSVVVGSLLCALELLSSGGVRGHGAALVVNMVSVHAVIGLIEAAGTVAILIAASRLAQLELATQRALTAVLALALAFVGAVGSSPWPDGLEFSLSRLGLGHLLDVPNSLSLWNGYSAIGLLIGMSLAALAAQQAAKLTRSGS
jgi:cobalt/nickel transport system permease protein